MRTVKYGVIAIAVIVILGVNVQAAFIVEAHSSGLANQNFEGVGDASLRSFAPGTTASNSLYSTGALGDWTYSYTPAFDADNYFPAAGADLTNGHAASGIVGGAPGLYNVYITWPASTNVKPEGCKITVTNDGDDVVLDPVNMNTGGTGTPGGNSGWYKIADRIHLTTGSTYTIHQVANNPAFVGQRSHGVLWELVEADPQLATIDESDGSTGVAEGGETDTYAITLVEQPAGVIVVTAEALDPNQLWLNGGLDSLELTFTPDDWDVEQVVTVEAFDDLAVEGDHAVVVLHMIRAADPNDDGFGGLVTVNITDNEAPDIRITESDGSTAVAEEGSTSDTYTVRLLFQPTDDVTINITADDDTLVDTGAGAASTAQLIFTSINWADEQTVTVSAIDDTDLEWVHWATISHSVSSLDGGYDGLTVGDVVVRIEDNDCGAWGLSAMDFDEDCVVGLSDFAAFVAVWMECTQPYGDNCIDLR